MLAARRRSLGRTKCESSGLRFEARAGQQPPRRGDVLRIDAEMRGEVEKIGFVREDEIEHGGEEGGIARSGADRLRSETALGEEAPETGAVARDEAEGLGGDRFRRVPIAEIAAFA